MSELVRAALRDITLTLHQQLDERMLEGLDAEAEGDTFTSSRAYAEIFLTQQYFNELATKTITDEFLNLERR